MANSEDTIDTEIASQIESLFEMSVENRRQAIAKKSYNFFKSLKYLDNKHAKQIYDSFKERWPKTEDQVADIEKELSNLIYEENSLEEGRFEILTELLDKACQSFEVFHEHEHRKIPFGHRLVLEARLLEIINNAFKKIQKICDNFEALRGDKDGINNERDLLRFEIRFCDMHLTEIHEHFLKSYLDMEW